MMNGITHLLTLLSLCMLISCAAPRLLVELPEEVTVLPDDLSNINFSEDYPLTLKRIGLQFHFINSLDSSLNYNADQAPQIVQSLIDAANHRMTHNAKMALPIDNQTPVLDTRIRYYVDDLQKDLIYHYEEEPSYFVKRGKKNNVYKRGITRKYNTHQEQTVQVVVQPFDPELLANGIEKLEQTAVALGNSIKLPGLRQIGTDGWSFAGIFNHEMGHVLGLKHSWNEDDGCADTPLHTNCWNTSSDPPCDKAASNNLMDYNAHQSAITPCQINTMHATMSNAGKRAHQLVKQLYCHRSTDSEVIISHPTIWNRSVLLNGDLLIRKGGILKITSGVHMPENSKVRIEKGGILILENATFYNSCNLLWSGIQIHPRGQLYQLGDANVLLHIATPPAG